MMLRAKVMQNDAEENEGGGWLLKKARGEW